MQYWTPDRDRVLFSIAEGDTNLTNAQIANLFTQKTGQATSEDAVRNRLKRIRRDIEVKDMAYAPFDDYIFDVPAAPMNEYVNFRLTFWDLESTNLSAMMGRILCCSFADEFGQVKTFRYEDYPGDTLLTMARSSSPSVTSWRRPRSA